MDREEAIFVDALSKQAGVERAAFLDQACGGDAQLRRRVDALLRAHERPRGILEAMPAQATVDAPSARAEGVGTTIGRYKLLEQIGSGGMGAVYMAEQTHPVRRKVALKIIKPGMDSQQVIARFEAERQALAMMDHPSIAKVLDAGTTDSGRPYFVMELVKGVPITDYCDQAKLPPRQRLELFVQVCHAVQHAHQKGIIHRDLKPSNVLVTLHDDKPVPKVIDFGIAKAMGQQLTEHTLFTQFAQMVGTPLYMSPEQAALSALDVDTRSDVYSLGVLLYELLTGTTPFDKERLRQAAYDEMRRIVREEEPPKPSTRLSSLGDKLSTISEQRKTDPKRLGQIVRGELDWIVMKALEKERARRYESASAMAGDIRRHLSDEPVEACPPSSWYRLRKFLRRNRGPVIAASAVAVALLVGSAAATIGFVHASRQRRNAIVSRDSEAQQRRVAEERTRDAEITRAQSLLEQGNALHLAGQGYQSRQTYLQAHDEYSRLGLSTLPTEAALYRSYRAFAAPINTLVGHTQALFAVVVAPDGRRAFTGSADQTIRCWDLLTGQTLRIFSGHGCAVHCLAISQDGKQLLSGDEHQTVLLWDTVTGQVIHKLDASSDSPAKHPREKLVNGVAFSRDGKIALAACSDQQIRIWDKETGRAIRTIPVQGVIPAISGVNSIACSPDGRSVLVPIERAFVEYEISSGNEMARYLGHVSSVASVAYSPDGKQIVSCGNDGAVRIWDVFKRETTRLIQHSTPVFEVAFTPDGRGVISGGLAKSLRLWDVQTGRQMAEYVGHTKQVTGIAISPDGQRLVSAGMDNLACIWSLKHQEVPPLSVQYPYVAVSPDGEMFLCADKEALRLYDMATLYPLQTYDTLNSRGFGVTNVAFVGDGRRFVTSPPLMIRDLASGRVERSDSHSEMSRVVPTRGLFFRRELMSGGIVEIDTFKRVLRLPFEDAAWFEFSPDGTRALSAGEHARKSTFPSDTFTVWDLQNGKPIFSAKQGSSIKSLALSRDGAEAFTGGYDCVVRLWNLNSKSVSHEFTGSAVPVCALALGGDGRTIYGLDETRCLHVWDKSSGAHAQLEEAYGTIGHIDGEGLFSIPNASQVLEVTPELIQVWDLQRVNQYRDYGTQLDAARNALAANPSDPKALRIFAEWYRFRGVDDWSVEMFTHARNAGAEVSSIALARGYWRAGQLGEAKLEFQKALARREASPDYLTLCIAAVSRNSPIKTPGPVAP